MIRLCMICMNFWPTIHRGSSLHIGYSTYREGHDDAVWLPAGQAVLHHGERVGHPECQRGTREAVWVTGVTLGQPFLHLSAMGLKLLWSWGVTWPRTPPSSWRCSRASPRHNHHFINTSSSGVSTYKPSCGIDSFLPLGCVRLLFFFFSLFRKYIKHPLLPFWIMCERAVSTDRVIGCRKK